MRARLVTNGSWFTVWRETGAVRNARLSRGRAASTFAASTKESFSIGRIPIGKEGSEYKVCEWRELRAHKR